MQARNFQSPLSRAAPSDCDSLAALSFRTCESGGPDTALRETWVQVETLILALAGRRRPNRAGRPVRLVWRRHILMN